jgi:hypothetical protein
VSAAPQFADAANYDSTDGAGLVILCVGLESLDEALGYLLEVRFSNLKPIRGLIADVAASKTETLTVIEAISGAASAEGDLLTQTAERRERPAEVFEATSVIGDTRLAQLFKQLEQLEVLWMSLSSKLQSRRSEVEAFQCEITNLKAAYLLARADSLLGGRSWASRDVELDAIAAHLLEALSTSEPRGHVWIVTAESAWSAPAMKAVDAPEMRLTRRMRKEHHRLHEDEEALRRLQGRSTDRTTGILMLSSDGSAPPVTVD